MEIKYTGMELKLHRHGIRTALASVFGAMLIATPFVGDSALANGIVTGKVFWFHLSMALMAIGTVVTAWPGGRKSIPFALPDGLLLLFAGITLATYDWQLDPEPEKLLFGGQLVVLWFLLRYFLTEAPCLKFFFLFVLMLTGLVEAVWGMQQLHGYAYSNHSLFRLTGSFFNPGPYCGYLAVVLPVCLWTALRFQKGMHYFGWVCAGAILIVLPAGMSRSAWMAAVVACGWVYWTERIGWEKTKAVCRRYKNATIPFIAIVAILVGCTIAGVYGMKQDSADGRLLMWKVTVKAIAGQPLAGTGLGGFPAAYAEAQGGYFATGNAIPGAWVADIQASHVRDTTAESEGWNRGRRVDRCSWHGWEPWRTMNRNERRTSRWRVGGHGVRGVILSVTVLQSFGVTDVLGRYVTEDGTQTESSALLNITRCASHYDDKS